MATLDEVITRLNVIKARAKLNGAEMVFVYADEDEMNTNDDGSMVPQDRRRHSGDYVHGVLLVSMDDVIEEIDQHTLNGCIFSP